MDKIEEVKKILMETRNFKEWPNICAEQICQLFEPKPDEGSLMFLDTKGQWILKSDTDRLLTPEQVCNAKEAKRQEKHITAVRPFTILHITNWDDTVILEAQDAKTASIYQQKIEALIEEIERQIKAQFSTMVWGSQNPVKGHEFFKEIKVILQALKATHTSKGGK